MIPGEPPSMQHSVTTDGSDGTPSPQHSKGICPQTKQTSCLCTLYNATEAPQFTSDYILSFGVQTVDLDKVMSSHCPPTELRPG